jgi:hypothetical protein
MANNDSGKSTNGAKSANGTKSASSNDTNSSNGTSNKLTGRNVLYYFGLLLLVCCILLITYYLKSTLNLWSFNLDKLNDDFSRSMTSKLHLTDDYGLDRNDYINVEYDIRTSDGTADCRIHGRANKDGLKYIRTKGSSDICQGLKTN